MNPNYLLVEAPSKVVKNKIPGGKDIQLLNTAINTSTPLKVVKISQFSDNGMDIEVGDHILVEGQLEKININGIEYMVAGLHSVILCLKSSNGVEINPDADSFRDLGADFDADHSVVLTSKGIKVADNNLQPIPEPMSIIIKDSTDISEFPNRSISSPALDMQRGY